MRTVGIIARRGAASEEAEETEGFFDAPGQDAPEPDRDTAEAGGKESPRRPWTKFQFALAALSATPLLFVGGLGGWPWEGEPASAEIPLPAGQQHYPVSVSLDRLGIEAPTDALAIDPATQTPQVPDFGRAGWYEAGPEPGELGRAVMFGRRAADGVDVFARLADARVSDRIVVRTVAGTDLTFVVRSVEQFRVADFPVSRVYGGPVQEAQLRLISSAGAYDAEKGFPRNVVVFADLLD